MFQKKEKKNDDDVKDEVTGVQGVLKIQITPSSGNGDFRDAENNPLHLSLCCIHFPSSPEGPCSARPRWGLRCTQKWAWQVAMLQGLLIDPPSLWIVINWSKIESLEKRG